MRQLLSISLFCLTTGIFAQTNIPNAGFENWTEAGGPFSSYLIPDDWATLNAQTAILGIIPASRVSGGEAYAGEYAIRLETNFIGLVGQMAPGLCVLGQINTDTQGVEGGIPIDARPHALNGWFRFLPNGVDTGEVRLTLTRWDELTGTRDTVGVGTFYPTQSTPTYTFFSAPVDYDSDLVPDTMQLILVSGSQFVAEEGSQIYFDELMLEYTPTGIADQHPEQATVFPNPARDRIGFEIKGASEIQIFDLSGKLTGRIPLQVGQQTVSITNLPKGQYILQFADDQARSVAVGRIVVLD